MACARLVLLVALAWPAQAGPARPVEPAHFDLGRVAYGRGDYDGCLQEMMLALMEDPKRSMAREYLRLSSEKLLGQKQGDMDRFRRGLLSAYEEAIHGARAQALRWNDWLHGARRDSRQGRWAAAYDGSKRVVEDNPLHEDALTGNLQARENMARSLGRGEFRNKKDALVYAGLLAYDRKENQEARQALEEALARSDLDAELSDERIRHYLDRLGKPKLPPPPPAVALRKLPSRPLAVASRKRPKPPASLASARSEGRGERRTPAPVPLPGQWAYAQGTLKLREGRVEEAVELLERASAEAPQEESFAKELIRARHELEAQRSERKSRAESLYTLGIVLYGQGKVQEAIAQWRKAAEIYPEHRYAQRALHHVEQELREEKP